MEHIWKVTGMKSTVVGDKSGVVVQTYWEKTSIDSNGKSGTFLGATPFTLSEDSEFIPMNLLTEEIVLGWIQAAIPPHLEQHMAEKIAKQIDAQYAPVVEVELPWIPQPVEQTAPTNEYEPGPAGPTVDDSNIGNR